MFRLCIFLRFAIFITTLQVWQSDSTTSGFLNSQGSNSRGRVVISGGIEPGPEATAVFLAALSWSRQGWTPLVLTVGQRWTTTRLGQHILAELRGVPGCTVLHLSNSSSKALSEVAPLFASLLSEVDPQSYLVVADPGVLSKDASAGILDLSKHNEQPSNQQNAAEASGRSVGAVTTTSSKETEDSRQVKASVVLRRCERSVYPHKVGAPAQLWAGMAMSWLGISTIPSSGEMLVSVLTSALDLYQFPSGNNTEPLGVASQVLGCMLGQIRDVVPRSLAPSDLRIESLTRPSWSKLWVSLRRLTFLRTEDHALIQRVYWQTHAPGCRQPFRMVPGKIFYFGITYPPNHKLAIIAHQTWGMLLPNMTWFTTAPPEPVDAFPWIVLETPRSTTGVHRADLITRTFAIWAYVYSHFWGFEWYVRCWDDNYIVGHRMARLASFFSPQAPIALGLQGTYGNVHYLGGGATSLVSQESLRVVFTAFGNDLGRCRQLCSKRAVSGWAEDVCFSLCSQKVGVRETKQCGFHTHHPFRKEMRKMSTQDLSCGFPSRGDLNGQPQCVYGPTFVGSITFHYVKKRSAMLQLHRWVMQERCEFCVV